LQHNQNLGEQADAKSLETVNCGENDHGGNSCTADNHVDNDQSVKANGQLVSGLVLAEHHSEELQQHKAEQN